MTEFSDAEIFIVKEKKVNEINVDDLEAYLEKCTNGSCNQEYKPAIEFRSDFIKLAKEHKIEDLTGIDVDDLGEITPEDINKVCTINWTNDGQSSSSNHKIPLQEIIKLRSLLKSIVSSSNSYENWKKIWLIDRKKSQKIETTSTKDRLTENEMLQDEYLEPFIADLPPNQEITYQRVAQEISVIDVKLNTAATINTLTLGVPFSVLG